MNWEPMTEDAVFEDDRQYLTARHLPEYGIGYIIMTTFIDGSFWKDDDEYDREVFTHFCRITNPNEVKP